MDERLVKMREGRAARSIGILSVSKVGNYTTLFWNASILSKRSAHWFFMLKYSSALFIAMNMQPVNVKNERNPASVFLPVR
jgi:hypothetical protein